MKIALPLLLLLGSVCPCLAGQSIDFTQHIVDLDGKDIPKSDKDQTPIDLATISETALLQEAQGGNRQPIDLSDKVKRFELALRIHDNKQVSLSSEEVTLLKQAVGAVFTPLVVGRVVQLIDPQPKEK